MKEERINNGQIDEWTIMEIQMKLQELKLQELKGDGSNE